MKTKILFCLALLVLTPTLAQAQPAIRATNGVLNASSALPDVARGSWFVIYGTGLGPATIFIQSAPPYPTVLSGTSITFTPASGGTPVSALMYYTLAGQIAGMLPSSTAVGAYNVTVTYNEQTSAPASVNVVARNFGFATQATNGQGPAQATYGGYDLNRFTTSTLGEWSLRPAKPGDVMVLWGTGLGPDPASDITGGSSGDQTAAGQVQVIVGGIAVTPVYAGRSSGSPGLDQINFTVPSNVTPSCFASLQVTAGGRLSNLGSIAVAAAGQTACYSQTLTQAQLQTLDKGGTLTIGSFHLGKTATTLTASGRTYNEQSESATGWFGEYTVDTVANANFALIQSGACFLIKRTGTLDQLAFGLPPQSLDAGAQLALNGPNASNIAIPRQSDNSYSAILYSSGLGTIVPRSGSPTLVQGTYTLAGTGGADVGSFSAAVSLPSDFSWTNENTIANPIPRASPLNVTWTGGGTGLVTIIGAAAAQAGGTTASPIYSAMAFDCIAPASAGNFTVSANILEQLPAASGDTAGNSVGTLALFAVPDPSTGQGTFTAPLTAGGTISQGILIYGVGALKTTGYN
jgi:uncharacterized protein (TIGR03437 family)